jgi:hypothetical protein
MILDMEYYDRWYEYLSPLQSNPYLFAEVACLNCCLFCYVHIRIVRSLWTKWDLVEEEGLQSHWNHFLDLLSEVDATTVCRGFSNQSRLIKLLFGIWRVSS